MLLTSKIVVFDSSTLGKISRDYWSQDVTSREKARSFIAELKHHGVLIVFTFHHVCELLRYSNNEVIRDRLRFLRSLPLIAWLRPYNREWFPGMISDLISRELHTVVHESSQSWREIVSKVRPELWETGVGYEMFAEDVVLHPEFINGLKRHHEKEILVASLARTDPGYNRDTKVSEILNQRFRTEDEIKAFVPQFIAAMQRQLNCHGDKRLSSSADIAVDHANKTLQSIRGIDRLGGDIIEELLRISGVPNELVHAEMTLGDLGELGVYIKRLKMLAKSLNPSVELTMKDVPPNTMPSYVLERKLASIQRKAERVSGSDMGDRHIAPLILYADAIEVDKRTCEYLKQVRRSEPELASLMGQFFTSSDYSQISISKF